MKKLIIILLLNVSVVGILLALVGADVLGQSGQRVVAGHELNALLGAPARDEVAEAGGRHRLQEGVFIRIMKVESGPVQRCFVRNFLNGDIFELLVNQQLYQGFHQHATAAQDAGIRRLSCGFGLELFSHSNFRIPSTAIDA